MQKIELEQILKDLVMINQKQKPYLLEIIELITIKCII